MRPIFEALEDVRAQLEGEMADRTLLHSGMADRGGTLGGFVSVLRNSEQ
jgi:hypothetical protein